MKELGEIFLKLVSVQSPSGFEEPMMKTLELEFKTSVDEVHETPRGNIIAVKKGSDPEAPSIALVAHMDQVGFIVFSIDDRGFIRFRKLGNPSLQTLQGQQMRILAKRGPVLGVVGVKPSHLVKQEQERMIPSLEEMYIDIGARSRQDVEKLGVTVGTPIVYNSLPLELSNNLIASSAVDDKGGCTALVATARWLRDTQIPSSVYYVGSVEEEIGLRGAEVVLNDLDVDIAVAIDTSPAGWQPDVAMSDIFYEVGSGPAIHVGEIGGGRTIIQHHKVREWLVETAESENIPYQMGIHTGHTDAMTLMQTKTGIPTAALGLPRKYAHSPFEVFDLNDLSNIVEILVASLRRLDANLVLRRT